MDRTILSDSLFSLISNYVILQDFQINIVFLDPIEGVHLIDINGTKNIEYLSYLELKDSDFNLFSGQTDQNLINF